MRKEACFFSIAVGGTFDTSACFFDKCSKLEPPSTERTVTGRWNATLEIDGSEGRAGDSVASLLLVLFSCAFWITLGRGLSFSGAGSFSLTAPHRFEDGNWEDFSGGRRHWNLLECLTAMPSTTRLIPMYSGTPTAACRWGMTSGRPLTHTNRTDYEYYALTSTLPAYIWAESPQCLRNGPLCGPEPLVMCPPAQQCRAGRSHRLRVPLWG